MKTLDDLKNDLAYINIEITNFYAFVEIKHVGNNDLFIAARKALEIIEKYQDILNDMLTIILCQTISESEVITKIQEKIKSNYKIH